MDKKITELNAAIEQTPNDAKLYTERAKRFFNLKKYDECIEDCERAISLDPDSTDAYNNRGSVYYNQEDYEKALADYNKAIGIDPGYVFAYCNRGSVYYNQKDYEKALANYDKAIELDPGYASAYNNRGNVHYNQKDYKKALANYDKAIELDPGYASAYGNRGNVHYDLKDYKKALSDYAKAKDLFTDKDSYWLRRAESRIEEISGLLSKTEGANKRTKQIIDAIEASGIKDSIKAVKDSFNTFIKEPAKAVDDDSFEFVVLRRWNSYTPIIAENNRFSKGGGYFIRLPKCGIVIDPGFNFIDNFKAEGHMFHEIDHVLITHAHNDHTTDLESILTLLHQYNEMIIGDFDAPEENTMMQEVLTAEKGNVADADRSRIEKAAKSKFAESNRRKRLRIYMSASTFKKYAPMLDLNQSTDYDVVIVKAGDKLQIEYPNPLATGPEKIPEITATKAKHSDLISDRDSLGFIVKYEDFVLVYTGDTGFSSEIEAQYKKIRKTYKGHDIVLLAHLGGFKEYETKFLADKGIEENQKHFYKNHLGRLGLAKLIEALEPRICLISEFGEEFKRTRLLLTEIYQKVYGETTFFPADIGLRMNADRKLWLVDEIGSEKDGAGYYNCSEALVCELDFDASLHYYKNGVVIESKLIESLTRRYYRQLY